MTLSDVSISRPVFTTMMAVALVVVGVLGITQLGTDLFPDVSLPVVVVSTVYRGAGPQEVESQVVRPIEDGVAGISGVDWIHSYSRENVGIVVIQFKLSQDIDHAVQETRDKVASLQNFLPHDADVPKVARVDISSQPILTFAASGDISTQDLRKLIKDRVEPALAQLEGVAEVRVTGGDTREIRVDIDVGKAKAAGVAPLLVAQQLGMDNVDVPSGRLELGPTEVTVRTLGKFNDVDQIRALPIAKSQSGTQLHLEEIAEVTDGVADRTQSARLNGKDAVILEVIKQPGTNTVTVADDVKRALAKLEPSLGNGFHASLLLDQSAFIRENTNEVWIALIFGGFMAVLIILVFLLDIRGTIISSLALPTSVIGTFFVMYAMKYTLNQMTLLALSLAIGLLIDDAVVVREAITHRLEKGEAPKDAASHGTKDVYLAVLATTLSLVAVFVPVAFMPGIVGKFFKQFGLTISAAVLISLFISFTLDPMLSSRFVKQRKPGEVRTENAVARVLRRSFEATERFYLAVLSWVLGHKLITTAIVVAVVGASAFSARNLQIEFLPAEDRSNYLVDLQLGDGASLDETTKRAAQVEALVKQAPEVRDIYTVVGFNGDANRARMRVLLVDKTKRARGISAIKEELRPKVVGTLPATNVALLDPPPLEGAGDFFPIMVRVIGPDLAVLQQQAARVRDELLAIPTSTDVRIDVNPPKPELQVAIDRVRASDVELTSASLGMQLRLAMTGQDVGKLRQGRDETPIVVRLSARDRASPEAISDIDVFTAKGVRPVSDVATVELHDGPSVIERHNRDRQITVVANVGKGGALGGVAAQLEKRLAKQPLPGGYSIIYDGQVKVMKEQMSAFIFAFILAFIFVYMVLASQFESFKHPFTIIVSVPLALVGAFVALVAGGYHLSMGAMIGIILLMGLVTKNAILLVDGALQNLRAGDDVETALKKAGPRRLRPILMTSAAMAIGMVPTAFGKGLGAEFRNPMALGVIGGVITSTLLTLVVVPVVFAFLEKLTPKRLRVHKDVPEKDEAAAEKEPAAAK